MESLASNEREDIMREVKQQYAIAHTQELLSKMTEKCFTKCVVKPGTSLDNSEKKCVAMCMDRYMDSWNLVSDTLRRRLEQERNLM